MEVSNPNHKQEQELLAKQRELVRIIQNPGSSPAAIDQANQQMQAASKQLEDLLEQDKAKYNAMGQQIGRELKKTKRFNRKLSLIVLPLLLAIIYLAVYFSHKVQGTSQKIFSFSVIGMAVVYAIGYLIMLITGE